MLPHWPHWIQLYVPPPLAGLALWQTGQLWLSKSISRIPSSTTSLPASFCGVWGGRFRLSKLDKYLTIRVNKLLTGEYSTKAVLDIGSKPTSLNLDWAPASRTKVA